MLRRAFLCALVALALQGCASVSREVFHSFDFDGWNDGWYSGPQSNVQLQEYSYGDQYYMVRKKAKHDEEFLPPGTSVSGPMLATAKSTTSAKRLVSITTACRAAPSRKQAQASQFLLKTSRVQTASMVPPSQRTHSTIPTGKSQHEKNA